MIALRLVRFTADFPAGCAVLICWTRKDAAQIETVDVRNGRRTDSARDHRDLTLKNSVHSHVACVCSKKIIVVNFSLKIKGSRK